MNAPKRRNRRPTKRPTEARTVMTADDHGVSFTKFEDKENLHPLSKEALSRMGLITMTEVQHKTFDPIADGRDVLGRARTGTGKTLSFLLPALERILKHPMPSQMNMLVLSPTRELAAQIGEQARMLLASHGPHLSYQIVFGGSPKSQDIKRFERRAPTILIGTPGRLRDHLNSTTVKGMPFKDLFRKTRILVLDETDRLLDMGFRKEVHDIISFLPHERQSLLFSATMPPEVRAVMAETMKPDYVTVDCIHDANPATHTNQQVDQSHVVVPNSRLVSSTVQVILQLMQQPDSKLVVFFPTAHLVAFYAALFNEGLKKSVLEIHSRKSQTYRTSASNRFREVQTGVLFTSDVSARGVDYAGVTHVVQLGIADSRETYIHRLGRTGRADKDGQGLLVLAELEHGFLKKLDGLDVPVHQDLQALLDDDVPQEIHDLLEPVFASIGDSTDKALVKSAKEAYRSVLGFYNGKLGKLGVKSPTDKLISFANGFAEQIGFEEPPPLLLKTARKMGLDRSPGLVISTEQAENSKRGLNRGTSQNPHERKRPHVDGGGAVSGSGTYEEWGSRAPGATVATSLPSKKPDKRNRTRNGRGPKKQVQKR